MRLLLDTSVFLWWLADEPRLGHDARAAIANSRSDVFVSAASIWEAEIKRALGKLRAPDDLAEHIASNYFMALAITIDHAASAGRLPPIHQDPFDRMLVAQARLEGLAVVTTDRNIPRYGVSVLPA